MKKIYSIFSSTRTMAVLLLLFGISIGFATFIENDFGTEGARSVVYNAKWFELLIVFGVVNMFAITFRYKMYTWNKLGQLLFHLAFVVILIGAAITRYFGIEGSVHIREGKSESNFITSITYLNIEVKRGENSRKVTIPVLFSSISKNKFKKSFEIDGHRTTVKLKAFIPKADEVLQPDDHGIDHAHFVSVGSAGRENLLLTPGDIFQLGTEEFHFLTTPDSTVTDNKIKIFVNLQGGLSFIAPFVVARTIMATQTTDSLMAGVVHPYLPLSLHNFNGSPLVLKQFMQKSSIAALPVDDKTAQLPSALIFTVEAEGASQEITLFGMKELEGDIKKCEIKGSQVFLSYGSIYKTLPFSLYLTDFIIKRYPGSESPSWFESKVKLNDTINGVSRDQRIFMNNILKYRGYRFYQASYDKDEHGTILSVNRDGWGSFITYLGYLIMALGMIITLLSKKSRFSMLSRLASQQNKVLGSLVLLILLFSANLEAQDSVGFKKYTLPEIPKQVSNEFGKVLVQDNGGRIEPLNTLASEVLRKVSRKENYKGQNAEQVMMGMLVYPQMWQQEPIIRVNHPEIQKLLGITSNYASFIDFFTGNSYGGYTLRQFVEEAYRKKPAYRTKFDNEIIRTDERLNICYLIYTGTALKIFPVPGDSSYTWHSPVDTEEFFSSEDSVFTQNILGYLFDEINQSQLNNNWKLPIELIHSLNKFQSQYAKSVLPTEKHIKIELFYNKANLFFQLMKVYLLIGLLLLLVQFLHIFFPKFKLKYFSTPAFVIIAIAFLLHALGLGMRWYIAGHAPWSNGFEALTFIAWATVLAGLLFSRKSAITISVTAVLAALILQTAHLSWMDPQITNLVPVLKSYWLVIHVAIITSSYGFMGLGALLAAVNLLLMFFQNEKNSNRIESNSLQLSQVIEMTLTAGLFLLSVGTFLGGVWANESWGRYWAWDPKETWALVTIIVYAVILHVRLIPEFKGRVLFNILALIGFSSVIMTYFGVNYYLSGLHSYAKGDPLPVPPIVYYSVAVVVILSLLAAYNQSRINKLQIKKEEKNEA